MLDPTFLGWLCFAGHDQQSEEHNLLLVLENSQVETLLGSDTEGQDTDLPEEEASVDGSLPSDQVLDDKGCYDSLCNHFKNQFLDGSTANNSTDQPIVSHHTLLMRHGETFCPEVIAIDKAMGRKYINNFMHLYSQESILFHRGIRGCEGSYL